MRRWGLRPIAFVLLVVTFGVAGHAAVQQAPADLTGLEQLRIENLNLQDELRKALLQRDTCRLQADVEKNHPGFTWDPATGTFTARPEGSAR